MTNKMKIGTCEVPVEEKELDQAILKFFPENPRTYSVISAYGEPTQDEIEDYMKSLDHVKKLAVGIERSGLMIPIMVIGGKNMVLDGNSRLAAYRILAGRDPVKWAKIRCQILPEDTSESTVATILGQLHLIGQKDWSPYEQASYLFRRKETTKLPVQVMADELGISRQKAQRMIEVMEFMKSKGDDNSKHWSHYEEYLKHSAITKFREQVPALDDAVVAAIKTEQIDAQGIRKVDEIAKVNDKNAKKILRRIADEEISIQDGYEIVKDSGKLEDVMKKLKRFQQELIKDDFEAQCLACTNRGDLKYVIGNIASQLMTIKRKLEK